MFSVTYIQQVLDHLARNEYGSLATIVGRYYAMDRDKRYERIKIAYEGLVHGTGESCTKENVVQVNYVFGNFWCDTLKDVYRSMDYKQCSVAL